MAVAPLRRLLAYGLLLLMPLGMGWGLPGCSACSETCDDQLFSPATHAYLLDFKPGSYWIYRNTQNGDLDSVYLVSAQVDSIKNRAPECLQESAYVILKGFAGKLQWGYTLSTYSNIIDSGGPSDIGFSGDFDLQHPVSLLVNQQAFSEILPLTNCCITGRAACYQEGCTKHYFRLLQLYFARNIGLIRWEAEYYPVFGKVTYELIRYKVVH